MEKFIVEASLIVGLSALFKLALENVVKPIKATAAGINNNFFFIYLLLVIS